MSKKAFVLALLLVSAVAAFANPVGLEQARKIGAKYLNASVGMKTNAQELTLAKTYYMANGQPAFYVFNASNGFVIVSAQDVATPILGYSDEGTFDANDIPEAMEWWLGEYANEIQFGIDNQNIDFEKTAYQWEKVAKTGKLGENGDRGVVVSPLLGEIIWNQNCYYNNLCPSATNAEYLCNHTYAGCVACAMSQIMRKWNYPEHGYGSHAEPPYGSSANVIDFSQTYYEWSNMPVALTDVYGALLDTITETQINAVATLMYHAGVAVNMSYSINGSVSSTENAVIAFKDNFGYSTELERERLDTSKEGGIAIWKRKLRSSLDHGYPLLYGGAPQVGTGHEFVCDGYDSDDYFHINWGYSGNQNGYYQIGALNYGAGSDTHYNASNDAIFNLHPSTDGTTSFTVNLSTNNEYGIATQSGSGTYNHGTNVTVTATVTPNSGYYFCYWIEDDVIVSENASYSFNIKYDRDLQAVFMDSFPISAETSNATAGTASSNASSIPYNGQCTLTATASDGYIFEHWTKGESIVSCDNPYTFQVKGPGTYVAHFIPLEGIYIGDNNNSSINVLPSNVNRKYTISEQIYTSEELGESGDISSIAFYNVGYDDMTVVTRSLDIYLKSTDKSSFVGTNSSGESSTDWIQEVTVEDMVFTGTVTFEYGTWTTILLDYTFPYDGTGNLAVIIVDHTNSTSGRHDFKTYSTSPSYTSIYKADDNSFDPTNMSEISGLRKTEKNKIIINKGAHSGTYTVGASVTPTGAGTVTGADTYAINTECTLTATPSSSDYVFRYWTKNGIVMSENPEYTFTVKNNVSLVAVFAAPSTVSVTANPAAGGTVTGAGEYIYGTTCNLTATAADGYVFNKWVVGGETMSTEETYSFMVTEDVEVVANFRSADMIVFEDNAVKTICVDNWDSNHDGELSLQEAAAVTDLGIVFKYNVNIESFNELQYFTGLTTIAAFSSCSKLESVIMPNTIETIGTSAFSNTKLSSITIPNSVTRIENTAFNGCSHLDGLLIIPSGVEYIGTEAFRNCSGIDKMIVKCPTPPIVNNNNAFENWVFSIPVYVPDGTVSAYQGATGWSQFTNFINQVSTSGGTTPTADGVLCVNSNYTLTTNAAAFYTYFANETNVLTIGNGGVLTVTEDLATTSASQLVIEDGGQLVLPNGAKVNATVKKSIAEPSKSVDGWYTIASPVNNMAIAGSSLVLESPAVYDLYRYDEPSVYWRNYKAHNDFTHLTNGSGYLYYNSTGADLSFVGELNSNNVVFPLSYTEGNGIYAGWNLIGNPFSHTIYKGTGAAIDNANLAQGYYLLNNHSGWQAKLGYSDPIAVGQGILVQATASANLTITNSTAAASGEKACHDFVEVTVSDGQFEDIAYVVFDTGVGLSKIDHLNENIPMLYIPQDGKDYAIALVGSDVKQVPLNLNAVSTGQYSMKVKTNGSIEYLHLIDNLTGADVDLLETPTFNFEAKPSDYASRFKLVFDAEDGASTGSETFAYYSDGNIIITDGSSTPSTGSGTAGTYTLQVMDMMGRVIRICTDVAHSVSTDGMSAGVYVLRLVSGKDVKTQKIVISPSQQ